MKILSVPLYYHKSDAYLESSEKTHLLASSDSEMTKDPSLIYREMQSKERTGEGLCLNIKKDKPPSWRFLVILSSV